MLPTTGATQTPAGITKASRRRPSSRSDNQVLAVYYAKLLRELKPARGNVRAGGTSAWLHLRGWTALTYPESFYSADVRQWLSSRMSSTLVTICDSGLGLSRARTERKKELSLNYTNGRKQPVGRLHTRRPRCSQYVYRFPWCYLASPIKA